MNQFSKYFKPKTLLPPIFFLVLAIIFQFSSPNTPDPDSFYHIKHADLYRQHGLFYSQFPWKYSVITTLSSDIWYGFHVFLIPFSVFNGTLGIKLAGAVLTFFAFLSLWFVLRRHNIKWPTFWPIFIFVSAPNIMNRFLMTRPHLLSLALSVLLFSFLITGGLWQIFIISALISWIHISLAWVMVLILGIVFLIKLLIEKKWLWQESLAVMFGAIIGWLLRPNPLGSLKLAYIQVVRLALEKQSNVPLLFGRELFPLSSQTLFQNFSIFILLWALGMIALIRIWRFFKAQPNNTKAFIFSSLFLSIVFFFLTILVARRAHDFWIPLGTIFIAAVSTIALTQARFRSLVIGVIGFMFVFLLIYTPYRNSISLEERAIPPDKFKEAALWLKDNSKPGDIVFNVRWSDFPMLYFWNQKNYYIGGMDPIFQYAFDEKLYWKFHYLSADQVTQKTCGAIACTAAMLEDTPTVLKNDFEAKYIFLEKSRNPMVYAYLESDLTHYEKKIDTGLEAVYEIK